MIGSFLSLAAAAVVPLLAQVVPPAHPPSPAPTLPPIGRVRATVPACVVTRDLVIPSFAAARRTDAAFAAAQQKLRKYVQIKDDDQLRHTPIYREGALAHLDTDLTTMMKEVYSMRTMLSDPRLQNSADKDVVAMHDQLVQLYGAEATRANVLYEYVTRERVDINKTDPNLTDNSALSPAKPQLGPAAVQTPIPGATFPPAGMPNLLGIGMNDVRAIDDWGNGYARMVRTSENQAAKTFLPIAQSCVAR